MGRDSQAGSHAQALPATIAIHIFIAFTPYFFGSFLTPVSKVSFLGDEGLYMRRARLFFDQNEAWMLFAEAHHKTPGHYWIVVLSMRFFGISDIFARLPFVLLALLSAWLVYEIGSLIVSRRAGAMASLILGTSYLWAVHSRTISPDMAYTSFFLGGGLAASARAGETCTVFSAVLPLASLVGPVFCSP